MFTITKSSRPVWSNLPATTPQSFPLDVLYVTYALSRWCRDGIFFFTPVSACWSSLDQVFWSMDDVEGSACEGEDAQRCTQQFTLRSIINNSHGHFANHNNYFPVYIASFLSKQLGQYGWCLNSKYVCFESAIGALSLTPLSFFLPYHKAKIYRNCLIIVTCCMRQIPFR